MGRAWENLQSSKAFQPLAPDEAAAQKGEAPGSTCATSTSQGGAAPSLLITCGEEEEGPEPAFHTPMQGWPGPASKRVTQANRSQTGSYLCKARGLA